MGLEQSFKQGFYLFFLALPIILINIVFFLGVGVGNLGLLFLALGQGVVVPIATAITQLFTGVLLPASLVMKPATDLGQLVPSAFFKTGQFNVAPSYWVAQVVFFFSYLFFNALDVYKMAPPSEQTATDEWRIENRKSRATMIMVLSCILLTWLLAFRYFLTDLDTVLGITIGVAVMGVLGWGWYLAASKIGVRTMDIFGIVQQMVPITEDANITYCVPPSA